MRIQSQGILERASTWQATVKEQEATERAQQDKLAAQAEAEARKQEEARFAQASVDRMEAALDVLMKLDNVDGRDSDPRAGEVQVAGMGRIAETSEGMKVSLEQGLELQAERPKPLDVELDPKSLRKAHLGSGESYTLSKDQSTILCEFTDDYLVAPRNLPSNVISAGPYPGVDRYDWYNQSVVDARKVNLSEGTVEKLPVRSSGKRAEAPRPVYGQKTEEKSLWQRLTGR